MALGRAFLSDLIELKRGGVLDRVHNVVEIGAQQLSDSFLNSGDLLDELYGLCGERKPPSEIGAFYNAC